MKSSPCRDCSCETIYRRIELPKTYQFGINSIEYIEYYVPIGDYAALSSSDYFTSFSDMQDDYNTTGLVATLSTKQHYRGPGFKPLHNNINEGVVYTDSFDFTYGGTYPSNTYYFTILYVPNPEFGKEIQYDPAVLSWPINQNVTCYDELKDPFWKLKFPICGTPDDKKDNDAIFKFKDCGKWKVEYRLRLRPLIFFGWPEDDDICKDHWLASGETVDNDENRNKMWAAYRFYSAMKEQAGAKYLGMTKLRLETGIFNENTQTENPIVWSKGKYPQPVIKYKDYWDSNFENGKYLYYKDPLCTPVQWEGMYPHLIASDMSEEQLEYKQFTYSFSNIIKPGMFTVQTNSVSSPGPGKIIISKKSQFKGDSYDSSKIPSKYLLNDPEKWLGDCILPIFTHNSGTIEIVQRGLINGVWKKLRKINYSTYNSVTETDESFSFDVGTGVVVNYDIPNLESTTQYYNGSSIKTKYELLIGINKVSKSVPKMVYSNIQIGNMTELVDDFVYELEGFTHVDMDKEKEISIYLKALPDSPSGHPLDFDTGFIEPFITNFQSMKNSTDPAIINESSLLPEKFWPWGVLSADERTGYKEQNKKVYEPLLPIRPDLIDFGSKIYNSIEAGRAYRWGHTLSDTNWVRRKNPNWNIMIEEGWIRLTKTCENCCD